MYKSKLIFILLLILLILCYYNSFQVASFKNNSTVGENQKSLADCFTQKMMQGYQYGGPKCFADSECNNGKCSRFGECITT